VFNNPCLEVSPSLGALVTLKCICCWVAGVADLKVLLKMLNEITPVDHFVGLDKLYQIT